MYFIIMLCFGVVMIDSLQVDLGFQDKFMEGENRYKELIKKSYGSCWKEALANLHSGCKHLTEEIQSRLALSFTNCFLEHSGSETCPCPEKTLISVCLRNSSDRIFSTYTEFFTHTQSICHYLQHREWQEQTQKTVDMLSENSEIVSKKLDESSKFQSKILDMQQIALRDQKQLIYSGKILNTELQKSREQARNAFEDFKSATNEQKHLIFEVFDRIKGLQHFVLGEFTSIYTFAYYMAGVFIIYILTSIPETAKARIWLLLLITGNVVVERILMSYNLDAEMSKMFPLDVNGPVFSSIWTCRKCVCTIGFVILLYFYHSYKDYNIINNELLKEIQRQNFELQEAFKSMKPLHLISPSLQNSKLEMPQLSNNVNHGYSMDHTITSVSSSFSSITREKVKKPHTPIDTPNHIGETKKLTNSANRTKKTVEKKTPMKTKTSKQINSTPKEVAILSSKENIEEGSPQKRYNLRSRVNSPAQSPYSSRLSPINSKDLVDAVAKQLETNLPFSQII
ncbi:UNVERIFIED_CONTAM: gamete expressed protein [Trichonephila clavipes]